MKIFKNKNAFEEIVKSAVKKTNDPLIVKVVEKIINDVKKGKDNAIKELEARFGINESKDILL